MKRSFRKERTLKFRVTPFLFLLLIGILWISPLPPCSATEEEPFPQAKTLEMITVTADKREENVQKVTTSVTVLSDTEIEDAHIESTRDLLRYVPNLTTTYTGSRDYFSRIKVRGISNSAFGDPAVALYIDDVSYADTYAFDSVLFDIERIEVLKGPQGTLYGKNTEGGAINIITKAPGNSFEARVGVEAGDYNKRQASGLINAPLIENKLFFRLSGLLSTRDGYIKNLYNDEDVDNQDTIAANAGLFFTPTDNLSFDLKVRAHEFEDDGGYPAAPMDKDKYMAATGLAGIDDFETSYNYIGKSSAKNNAASLRINYELDQFDLISVTAYRGLDNEGTLDGDFSPSQMYVGFNSVESDSITQEVRIKSKDSNESFKWLLGLYYSNDDKEYETGYGMDHIVADRLGVPLYTEDKHSATTEAEDMAVFGQSTLRFFNDAIGLTAGLRYENSERTLDHQHTFGGSPAADPINGLEDSNSELLPKVALDYRINDNIMTYASFARGYKAGGFAYAVDDPDIASFDPEISNAFELGLKTEFPEHGFRVNVAGFYTDVDDFQDRVRYDAMTVIQANVTETKIYGAELEASYALTDEFSLNGFFGYTHAEYGEYLNAITGENYEGNRVEGIPEYDFGLFLEYRNQLGIFARAEMQGFGSYYLSRENSMEQGSYILYNAKIGYENENWDVYLTVQNITDEQYFLEGFEDTTLGWVGIVGGTPRTFVLSFSYRF